MGNFFHHIAQQLLSYSPPLGAVQGAVKPDPCLSWESGTKCTSVQPARFPNIVVLLVQAVQQTPGGYVTR
jgi:hypothetical protein